MAGLSILIPVYNENPTTLIHALVDQLSSISTKIDIHVLDDGSTETFYNDWSSTLSSHPFLFIHRHPQNVGRSATRNHLWEYATQDYRLYLDGDTIPCSDRFLQEYVRRLSLETMVICGGTRYREYNWPRSYQLRYTYGKKREEHTVEKRTTGQVAYFTSNNILLHKSVLTPPLFLEKIKGYGHEDTLFGIRLTESNIPIQAIDNAVYHEGIEDNNTFLSKSKEAVKNLVLLYNENNNLKKHIRLIQVYHLCTRTLIGKGFLTISCFFLPILHKSCITFPRLLLFFDAYKLVLFHFYSKSEHEHRKL